VGGAPPISYSPVQSRSSPAGPGLASRRTATEWRRTSAAVEWDSGQVYTAQVGGCEVVPSTVEVMLVMERQGVVARGTPGHLSGVADVAAEVKEQVAGEVDRAAMRSVMEVSTTDTARRSLREIVGVVFVPLGSQPGQVLSGTVSSTQATAFVRSRHVRSVGIRMSHTTSDVRRYRRSPVPGQTPAPPTPPMITCPCTARAWRAETELANHGRQ
jgi:hypothetical protein